LVPLLLCWQGYIQGEEFKPKGWIIPGLGYDTYGNGKVLSLSSNGMYSLRKMSLRSKRIADTVEALIGAYLSTAGEQAAFLFLKSLGMDIEFHSKIPAERTIAIKSEEFINVRSLETILGYEFKDRLLLMEALTHGSYQIAGTTACYQVDLKASTPLSEFRYSYFTLSFTNFLFYQVQ
jgi:endoribonuclease Dicer